LGVGEGGEEIEHLFPRGVEMAHGAVALAFGERLGGCEQRKQKDGKK
jgi:hypothetical protein